MNLLKHENKITNSVIITLLIGILIIITIIIIYFVKGYINGGEIDPSLFGTFGDFIGGVIGTIFTLAATLLILLTYHSQKAELQATNRIAALQSQTQKRQMFESTFFNMLNSLERSRSVVEVSKSQVYLFADYKKEDYVSIGIESFSTFYKYFRKKLKEMTDEYPEQDREENNIFNTVRRSIDTLNIKFYFDQINVIYEYLNSNPELSDRFYYSVIYAQFTKYEKLILFYVGISKIYPAIFKALKEKKEFDRFEFINELPDTRHIEYYGLEDIRGRVNF